MPLVRETGGCCVPHTHHTPPSGGPIGRCRREKRQRHADPWFMDEHIECVSTQLVEGAINRFWARGGLWAAWAVGSVATWGRGGVGAAVLVAGTSNRQTRRTLPPCGACVMIIGLAAALLPSPPLFP